MKLLIWCWVSAGSLLTLHDSFRLSLIKLRWGSCSWMGSVGDTHVKPVKGLFGNHLLRIRHFFPHSPFVPVLPSSPLLKCTCKCHLPDRGTASTLKGWWMHYLFTWTWFIHKQLKSASFFFFLLFLGRALSTTPSFSWWKFSQSFSRFQSQLFWQKLQWMSKTSVVPSKWTVIMTVK